MVKILTSAPETLKTFDGWHAIGNRDSLSPVVAKKRYCDKDYGE